MIVTIASDHGGYKVKEAIIEWFYLQSARVQASRLMWPECHWTQGPGSLWRLWFQPRGPDLGGQDDAA